MIIRTKVLLIIAINLTVILMFKSDSYELISNGVISLNPIYLLGMFSLILQMAILFAGSCFSNENCLATYEFFRCQSTFKMIWIKYLSVVFKLTLILLIFLTTYSIFFISTSNLSVVDLGYKIISIFISLYYYMILELMLGEYYAFFTFCTISLSALLVNQLSINFYNMSLAFIWPTNMWFSRISNSACAVIIAIIFGCAVVITPSIVSRKNFN